MQKFAIVWRESAYKTGRCCSCGRKVMGADGIDPIRKRTQILLRTGYDGMMRECVVCDCGNVVAIIKQYEGTGKPGERRGRWLGDL